MLYWWVNQNQTYRAEVRGSFMWSPKQNANGARNQFYDNMRAVSPGDIVFSFCDTRINAIGVVTGDAQTGPKPDFGVAGANWSREGWFVPVDYCVLNNQIRPKDHAAILRPFLPAKYSPLQESGDGLQSVYLAELPQALADALIGLIGYPSGKAGDVLTVEFTAFGIPCLGLNGGPAFKQSEAFSFQIATDDQAETDRYWNAIVGNGGQESACGWCKDRWGLSWQITPRVLTDALAAGGAEAKRAFEAMMSMKKIDVATIEAARRG